MNLGRSRTGVSVFSPFRLDGSILIPDTVCIPHVVISVVPLPRVTQLSKPAIRAEPHFGCTLVVPIVVRGLCWGATTAFITVDWKYITCRCSGAKESTK